MWTRLREALPSAFLLDAADLRELSDQLSRRGWIDGPVLAAAPAGEGNMNLTLRVTTATGSLIVKQARPWVERYPQLEAPVSRATVEARFYEVAAAQPALAAHMPRLLGFDPTSALIALEDLGPTTDLSSAWAGGALPDPVVAGVLGWLSALHTLPVDAAPVWENRALRALNHAHVFEIPLQTDPTALEGWVPGLSGPAQALRRDARWTSAIHDAGRRYLADGQVLLHGDLHWGSVVEAKRGWFVLDPEFAFRGDPGWDLGVILAHLVFAGRDPDHALRVVARHYHGPADLRAARVFAAAELMRRLLGLARLPTAPPRLDTARHWLDTSHRWATP